MLQNLAEKSSAEKVRLRKVRPRKFVAMYGREMLQNSAEKILLYTIGKKIRKFKPSTEASTLWDASLTIDWDRVGCLLDDRLGPRGRRSNDVDREASTF